MAVTVGSPMDRMTVRRFSLILVVASCGLLMKVLDCKKLIPIMASSSIVD